MRREIRIQSLPGFQSEAKIGKLSVKPGDIVKKDQEIASIEGAKATVELKSQWDGEIISIEVQEGETVRAQSLIGIMEADESEEASQVKELIEINAKSLPGMQDEAAIGKINVAVGDDVKKGDILLSLEGAKCNMDIVAEADGRIVSVEVEEGDKIKKGNLLFKMEISLSEKIDEKEDEKEQREYHAEVVVLGGGPGGYVAAIRSAQRGKKTIIIEEDQLGGTCLNRGCIPTKSLVQSTRVMDMIKSADVYGIENSSGNYAMSKIIDRKNDVVNTLISGLNCKMENNDITVLRGHGSINDHDSLKVQLQDHDAIVTFDDLILAPGSVVAFPPFDGADHPTNLTSDELLDLREIPESLIILGGRVIAMEFAFIYNKLGCDVTVIQRSNTIFPNLDQDVIDEVRQSAIDSGIKIYEGTKVEKIETAEDGSKIVEFLQGEEKTRRIVTAEKLAIATGRKPNLKGLELDKLGVQLWDNNKGIKVDSHMKTTREHVYAIGDATNLFDLAHVASAQALVAVDNITGKDSQMRYDAIPSAIFTDPEIGIVGMSEKDLKKEGISYITGKFPYMANGKALVENATNGFVKVIARKEDRKIVGANLVGASAADLMSAMGNLITLGATIEEAESVIYAHPTVSETLAEAVMDLNGESIHG